MLIIISEFESVMVTMTLLCGSFIMVCSFMLAIRYSRTFGEKIKRASVQNIKTWEKFVEKLLTRWTSVYGRLFHIFNSNLAIYKNLFMFSNVKNYIGDMLCAGGRCSLAIATRCCTAWGKFKKLLPLLTSKHISLSARGRVFNSCVRSALLHGSETWATTDADLKRLQRNDRAMVRWICGTKPTDEAPTELLCTKLGIQGVIDALRARRLRWYGHVMRSTACINSVTNMRLPCPGKRRRPRKTWSECIKADLKSYNLVDIDPLKSFLEIEC